MGHPIDQYFLICFSTLFPTQVTPLHLAAYFKSSATVVSTLLQAGANVDALDSDQMSPLHLSLIHISEPTRPY